MYKKQTVKVFSIIAIVLSSLGMLLSIIGSIFLADEGYGLSFFMGILSWAILVWASVLGYKLCTKYDLYDDEYKKIAIRIYLIIVAFILFFFVGLVLGLALSVGLLVTIWGMKKNYDEWAYTNTPYVPEESTQEERL